MLLDLIRKIVPIKYRQSIGLWTACQSGRSEWLLYPYFLLICGTVPKNLKLLPGGDCVIRYKGADILCPRDSIFTSWEVLQDEIYEKFHSPQDGDTVLDIGAHVGLFTVKASLLVGNKGSVIAIEPSSSNARYLIWNTKTLANVLVVLAAVSSFSGEGRLSLSSASPCHTLTGTPDERTETVLVDTVDSIVSRLGIRKVDFIKIDAEGSELEILKGATDTLKNNKLKLAVASYHNLPTGEHELPYVSQLLASAGFRMNIVKGYIYAEND